VRGLGLVAILAVGLQLVGAGFSAGAGAADPVLAYIERVETFVNRTLQVAEYYDITINETHEAVINETYNLIEQAYAQAGAGNTTLAIELAANASNTFAPIAAYIYSSIPAPDREELELAQQIMARFEVTHRLRNMLKLANETNTTQLMQQLEAVERQLLQARQLLLAGNTTAAKTILETLDLNLNETAKQLKHQIQYAHKHAQPALGDTHKPGAPQADAGHKNKGGNNK